MLARRIRAGGAKILCRIRVGYYRAMGITIGRNCYISSRARIDVRRGKVVLGNNVRISGGSYVLGHTGLRPLREGQETRIDDNVRVFVNAVILDGVKVGANSIVSAGAVVMKDVPPNVVVMGNPARVVKYLEDENE